MAKDTKRPVGYMPDYKPQEKTVTLINNVLAILQQYRSYGPMTARQIFYRLVATAAYKKTEQAYANLCEVLVKARRAEMIPFEAIRDDGDTADEARGYASLVDFFSVVRNAAQHFNLKADVGQPKKIILMCEASGMVPMLAQMAHPYGVTVMSAGGFNGLTGKYKLAEAADILFDETNRETVILHIGDHDPSGVHVFDNLDRDVNALAHTAIIEFERIAVTEEQIISMALETAPAKTTDRREFYGVGGDPTATVQAEAIDPATLSQIVVDAIHRHWDFAASDAMREAEAEAKQKIEEWLDKIPEDNE